MTQKQLADLVHIDESMINKIENGHSTGSIRTLTKLAAALGVRIDELIGEQSLNSGRSLVQSTAAPLQPPVNSSFFVYLGLLSQFVRNSLSN